MGVGGAFGRSIRKDIGRSSGGVAAALAVMFGSWGISEGRWRRPSGRTVARFVFALTWWVHAPDGTSNKCAILARTMGVRCVRVALNDDSVSDDRWERCVSISTFIDDDDRLATRDVHDSVIWSECRRLPRLGMIRPLGAMRWRGLDDVRLDV